MTLASLISGHRRKGEDIKSFCRRMALKLNTSSARIKRLIYREVEHVKEYEAEGLMRLHTATMRARAAVEMIDRMRKRTPRPCHHDGQPCRQRSCPSGCPRLP
ncbi:hypothetical protein ACJ41P_10415 [Azospirillum argentinense]|uniref:Uncharacterized protein n=1 Tax=Azospirillum argentinense TaxID=2970906 RepID=A0ABW8V591_9PROT